MAWQVPCQGNDSRSQWISSNKPIKKCPASKMTGHKYSKWINMITHKPLPAQYIVRPYIKTPSIPLYLPGGFTADRVSKLTTAVLNKHVKHKLWREMESRMGLLDSMRTQLQYYDQLSFKNGMEYPNEFKLFYASIEDQIEYVECCLSQLDIKDTIDQVPEGDSNFSYTNFSPINLTPIVVTKGEPLRKHWSRYLKQYRVKDLYSKYSLIIRKPSPKPDLASEMLTRASYNARRSVMLQRTYAEVGTRNEQGWFMVFDTLTLSPDMQRAFYENPNALRDYFRNIARAVLRAEGRSVTDDHSDCYSYLCVPEYGGERGRLHFHALHFMRTLPKDSKDPNFGRNVRNRRQIDSLRGFWGYGFSQPIAIRYKGDAFTRRGWLTPIGKDGKPMQMKPPQAVAGYVCKYINKNVSQKCSDKVTQTRMKSCPIQLPQNPAFQKAFRVRSSRHFGRASLPTQDLSVAALLELTNLDNSLTPYPRILRHCARQELAKRASMLTLAEIRECALPQPNLLKLLRSTMQMETRFNQQSFMSTMTLPLTVKDISDETALWLQRESLEFWTRQNRTAHAFVGAPK